MRAVRFVAFEQHFQTVLQSAMERGYLDKNPAHGIRIRTTGIRVERRFYSPAQVRQLLPELTEPCRTVVQFAVLTGLRIGEILALRWKRVDLLRGTIEVAETYSDGEFGPPKTRSSNRVIPISGFLRESFGIPSGQHELQSAGRPGVLHTERNASQPKKPLQPRACARV